MKTQIVPYTISLAKPIQICNSNKPVNKSWSELQLSNNKLYYIMSKSVFAASGHLSNFIDPVVKCKKCSSSFRADKLIQEAVPFLHET